MVSKANVDFPLPDSPVMTTSWSRGISRLISRKLCSRAPLMRMDLRLMDGCFACYMACCFPGDSTKPAIIFGHQTESKTRRGIIHELAKIFVHQGHQGTRSFFF